jgi:hypothetical protein
MAFGYKTVLQIGTSSFEFDVCDYEFSKDINTETGKPIDRILGGMVHLGSIDMPDNTIIEWALEHAAHTGNLKVLRHDNRFGSYIVDEEIAFIEAVCVSFKVQYNRFSDSHFCTFTSFTAKDMKVGKSLPVKKDWNLKAYSVQSTGSEKIPIDLPSFGENDTSVYATLHLEGSEYDLITFESEFEQDIDWKGEPQHSVKGGLLSFTLNQSADETLNHWMFDDSIAMHGFISFGPKERRANLPLVISFIEGRCIRYKKDISNHQEGIRLQMIISPSLVAFNGIKHKNNPQYVEPKD